MYTTTDYFKILTNDMHAITMSVIDAQNLPASKVINLMYYDVNGIYFIMYKTHPFYNRLHIRPYVSITGITTGENPLERRSIDMTSAIRNIGSEKLDEIFNRNPYLEQVCPDPKSRRNLFDVFCIYRGQGVYLDQSTWSNKQQHFSFGGKRSEQYGYYITESCDGCGLCESICPQHGIIEGSPFKINQTCCLHCGNCYAICPNDSIIRRHGDD